VRAEREEVRLLADARELRAAEELRRHDPAVRRQVELGVEDEARQVGDDEDALVAVAAHEREHLAVLGVEHLDGAAAERGWRLRSAVRRFIHHSIECGFCCCCSAFTAAGWYSGATTTGR
jgi:hypothetical protein